jgi:ABC-type nickel/cobalt efflux system permease component RcnA
VGALPVRRVTAPVALAPDHTHEDHHHPHDHAHDHDHPHDHSHDHAHDHDHEYGHSHGGHYHTHGPVRVEGRRALIGLGISGGLVPCPDALAILLLAVSVGQIALGIGLVVAFSAGLAAVLIGLGVGVVYANRAGGRRFGERKWFKFLPVFSAALLVALGVWFVRDGWQFLVAAARP